ncbi:MAG: Permease of the drug/metabolite transporter superfamily [Hydrocarboniphaga sp.]|uniref:EamA family transporter n=1 Tax=Hydrocarboniphaga sp. TaxID=2033016 RepID=UPI00262E30D9|nr:EamA family transporter [Hydrocarboniphaga sp.]MDB5973178.1 Permease of the drug/metabolite transporter superfamily [Hydrocarboniphaga sp.]
MNARAVRLLLAFAAVYLVWGSTYLAIRIVVEHLPAALSAGIRFLVAGTLMLVYAGLRGGRLPKTRGEWASVAFTGIAMLVAGNGLVTWAEQWVESNQAALIIATSALWMAGLGTLGAKGERITPLALCGLFAGFAGVALLVGGALQARSAPMPAYLALLAAPFFWALGSVYAKRHPVAITSAMSAALQMLIAGAVLAGLGLAAGEAAQMSWEPRGLLALLYLIVFGSCVAYGAFFYLVHEVSPALLGTYAYVNPAIAVVLGWWILDEHLGRAQIIGTAVILLGVVLVSVGSARKKAPA